MLRRLALHLCLFLFVFAPAATQAAGWSTLDVNGEVVRIYRDDFGRPHIFAKTNRGLFTAYGYALAEDRLWQLEVNRRVARGRLAEIFGPGMPVLSDKFVRTTGYTDAELDAQFAALDDAVLDDVDNFTLPEVIPLLFSATPIPPTLVRTTFALALRR